MLCSDTVFVRRNKARRGDLQALAINPGTLFVEQDFDFMVLLANNRFGDITYKDIDETTFNGEPIAIDNDAWQIR